MWTSLARNAQNLPPLVGLLILIAAPVAHGQREPGQVRGIPQGLPPMPPAHPTGPLLPGVNLEECAVHTMTPFDPRWHLVASTSLRGLWRATATHADSLEFDAAGILRLELTRPSNLVRNGVTVVVRVQPRPDAGFSELCRIVIPRLHAGQPAEITRQLPSGGPARVRVEVLDPSNGGPTGDPPYTVSLRATASIAPPSRLPRRSMPPGDVIPECDVVDGPKRPQASLELVRTVSFDGTHRHWRYLDYAEAGRNVYLRLNHSLPDNGAAAIEVQAFAKNGSRDPFKPVCRVTLTGTESSKRLVLAARPASDDHLFDPIWRLEARPVKVSGDALAAVSANVQVYREVDPERSFSTSYQQGGQSPLGSLAFLCVPQRDRLATRVNTGGFTTSQVVDVEIDADPKLMSPSTMRTLELYIVHAAGLWRESCQQCQIDSLLLLKVNGRMYWRDNAVTLTPAQGQNPADIAGVFIGRGGIAQFLNPESTANVKQQVCAIPYSAASPRLQSIQRHMGCNGATPSTIQAKVRLQIQRKTTTCGDDPDIVACESNNNLIELNAKDYSFRTFGFGDTLVRGGPRQMDLFHVILHEMGHWIGIEHQDSAGSIMSPQYSTSRCIDGDTAAVIGSVAPNPGAGTTKRAFRYEGAANADR